MALDRRVDNLEHALERLAEAQVRTEERLARLEAVVERLAEAQVRLEATVERLARAQARTEEQLGLLVREVAALKGDSLERRYRDNAAAYFQRILRRVRSVSKAELGQIADDAEEQGILSLSEHEQLLQADVVVHGRLRATDTETYLLAEVSSVVDQGDVQRAVDRAQLLGRATGLPVVAAVAGGGITPAAERRIAALEVWCVLNGRAYPPGEQIQPPDAR